MNRHVAHFLLSFSLLAPISSLADVGPKPNFELFFDESVGADINAELLACDDSTCAEPHPFREFGPQRFDCTSPGVKEAHSCFALAYGFPPFLKVRLQVNGKTYQSEPFSPGGDADVTLVDDQLVVRKRLLSSLFCFWCWLK